MSDKLLEIAPMLSGDNTIPGEVIPDAIQRKMPEIFDVCRAVGLDFYETVVEFLDWDSMAEVCSYGGFPSRYPHWSFGMEWEDFVKNYKMGMHRVYEIVVNTNPCYLYCLNSNTYTDNVTVIAHATAHNDFFKNNVFFQKTSQNMMNELANHGTRVRRYASEWGPENVGRFIDKILSIDTLIDPAAAWKKRELKEIVYRPQREYQFPRRLKVEHDYMEKWINKSVFVPAKLLMMLKREYEPPPAALPVTFWLQ